MGHSLVTHWSVSWSAHLRPHHWSLMGHSLVTLSSGSIISCCTHSCQLLPQQLWLHVQHGSQLTQRCLIFPQAVHRPGQQHSPRYSSTFKTGGSYMQAGYVKGHVSAMTVFHCIRRQHPACILCGTDKHNQFKQTCMFFKTPVCQSCNLPDDRSKPRNFVGRRWHLQWYAPCPSA